MIAVNNILNRVCKLNGLGFIDDSNICFKNLFKDSLHWSDYGKVILANNFIYVLNRSILWYETFYNGTCKYNILLKANFYNENYGFSNISNSFEVKEPYPCIYNVLVGNPDLRALHKKIK